MPQSQRVVGLGVIAFACVWLLMGCNQRPAVPTVAIAPTEPVVVVVVTATSQPTLAPTATAEATITPLPTLTPVVTTTVTATVQTLATRAVTRVAATTVAVAPKPTTAAGATQPTAGAGAPTTAAGAPTVGAAGFPAPVSSGPQGMSFRDGDALKFAFSSVGQLGPQQCYQVTATLGNPNGPGGVGDYWVGLCGDQNAAGTPLVFIVRPGRFHNDPNYGTLLTSADSVIPPTPQYNMAWTVSVVEVQDASDPIHPKTQAISPPSVPLSDVFFRS